MLRVESGTKLEGFTEFEEDILFDDDDPDFDHNAIHNVIFKNERGLMIASTMSLASVHPAELHSSHGSLATLSHSLDDISGASWSSLTHSDAVMTIEEIRNQMHCCFTCGVSWAESHVSLDCSECGGYALDRPCIACDGTCGAVWKRDLSMTHASGKARWKGECSQTSTESQQCQKSSAAITQDLSLRMEKLSANNS